MTPIREGLEKERDRISDYKDIFMDGTEGVSDIGERILKDIGWFCHIGSVHTGDTPTEVARMSGRREAYNWIYKSIYNDRLGDLDGEIRILREQEHREETEDE